MPVWQQVRDVMLITLWVFTGIEGAVVLSSRAKRRNDIGKATLLGVLLALGFYVMVTVLSYGINTRAEIAGMHNPSMASILAQLIGLPGTIVITLGLIISVSSSYLSGPYLQPKFHFWLQKMAPFQKVFKNQYQ